MATQTAVRNQALRKLGVLESGGTPTTDEATDADAAYDYVYEYLVRKNAVYWDSDEDVPDEAVYPVVKILAFELSDEFGVTDMRRQFLKVEAYGVPGTSDNGALGELIFLASTKYVSTPTEAEYY